MKKHVSLVVMLLSCTLLIFPFQAIAMSLGTAGQFNTFVFEDFTGYSDTEGRLAVGGNASLFNYSVGLKDQGGDTLVVDGNLTISNAELYGNVLVSGTTKLQGTTVKNGTVIQGQSLPIDFATEEAYLKDLSTSLAQLGANATVEKQWGGMYLAGDGSSQLQVFNLNGKDVLDAHTFQVSNIAEGATVVFNISGDTAGLTDMSLNSLTSIRDHVLFNFYDANTLTLSGIGVEGSILAPWADVNHAQGQINGTLIAKSFNGQMQQNHALFTGNLPGSPVPNLPTPEIPTTVVPEPTTLLLLGIGLLGLAGLRKRNRK